MLSGMASPTTLGAILARNIAAARAGRGLQQSDLADRMRALGWKWVRQTVGEIENNRRRLTAEEVLGLAICLETTMLRLLTPLWTEEEVELPGGISLPQASVRIVLSGPDPEMGKFSQVRIDYPAERGVRWQDNTPARVTTPYEGSAAPEGGG